MTSALLAALNAPSGPAAAPLAEATAMRREHQPSAAAAVMQGTARRCTDRPTIPGPIETVRTWQERESARLRAGLRRAAVLRSLRAVCGDVDECLGRVTEATRAGDATAAFEPLGEARDLAASMLRALRRPVPSPSTGASPDALDEDWILTALGILEELDSQLRDAGIGYHGAGWRGACLAERLASAVDQLVNAAMTGRTRCRGDEVPGSDR